MWDTFLTIIICTYSTVKSDLLQRISEKSGIPAENVEYARVSVV